MSHEIDSSYAELKAFMQQLQKGGYINNPKIAEGYNDLVSCLEKNSGQDYSKFKVDTKSQLDSDELWSNGMRLLARVNTENRLEKETPSYRWVSENLGSASQTTITQNNSQEVTTLVMVSVVMELTERLTRVESEYQEDSPERNFIDIVKSGLKGAKDILEVLALIIATAQQTGLGIQQLSKLFHL